MGTQPDRHSAPIPQRESTSTPGLRSHQLRVDRLEERIRIRVKESQD